MGKSPNLLQGTLDLLILHAPALSRLELDGCISAAWGLSENNRKAKYYKITGRGRKILAGQQESWTRLSAAVQQVLAR